MGIKLKSRMREICKYGSVRGIDILLAEKMIKKNKQGEL